MPRHFFRSVSIQCGLGQTMRAPDASQSRQGRSFRGTVSASAGRSEAM